MFVPASPNPHLTIEVIKRAQEAMALYCGPCLIPSRTSSSANWGIDSAFSKNSWHPLANKRHPWRTSLMISPFSADTMRFVVIFMANLMGFWVQSLPTSL